MEFDGFFVAITIENVNGNGGGPSIGGDTGVVARVGLVSLFNGEDALLSIPVDDHTTNIVIIDHPVIMVPENIDGRLRALPEHTHQLKCAPAPYMFVGLPQDLRFCLYRNRIQNFYLFSLKLVSLLVS